MVFCFARPDYSRFDGNGGSIDGLPGREVSQAKASGAIEEMAAKLSPSARPKVLGENVSRIYELGV
jgi:hypothetical protein